MANGYFYIANVNLKSQINRMNTTAEIKDVFISYRRSSGATVARLLCDVLTQRNISIFFDKESLGEGNFDDAIEHNLHAARNFILIVSPGLFDRGKNANGQYDPLLSDADWVYREIRIALASGKPIIPIFVNGEQGFPAILPPGIEDICRKDALTFGHDHFEPELSKLLSRIITNKDQLIESYIRNLKHLPAKEQGETLIDLFESLGGDKATEEIISIISNRLRLLFNSQNKSLPIINAIADSLSLGLLKNICKDLHIDNTGDISYIKSNMGNWILNKEYREFSKETEERDRINEIIVAFSKAYKSHEKRAKAISMAEKELQLDLDYRRSSFDIFCEIFEYFGVEEFFEKTSNQITEDEIKTVALYLFSNNKGRKNDLISRIVDYANYEYDLEQLE